VPQTTISDPHNGTKSVQRRWHSEGFVHMLPRPSAKRAATSQEGLPSVLSHPVQGAGETGREDRKSEDCV